MELRSFSLRRFDTQNLSPNNKPYSWLFKAGVVRDVVISGNFDYSFEKSDTSYALAYDVEYYPENIFERLIDLRGDITNNYYLALSAGINFPIKHGSGLVSITYLKGNQSGPGLMYDTSGNYFKINIGMYLNDRRS